MRSGAGRLVSTFAVVLVTTLPVAPLAGLIGSACDRCPPDCPMHAKTKPSCHHAPAAHHGRAGRCVAGIARPGCGHGRETPPITIVRAVLPMPVPWCPALSRVVSHPAAPPVSARDADPPEPPPPIPVV